MRGKSFFFFFFFWGGGVNCSIPLDTGLPLRQFSSTLFSGDTDSLSQVEVDTW